MKSAADQSAASVVDPDLTQFQVSSPRSLAEQRPRVLKHDDTFAVFDHAGSMCFGRGSSDGIYHRDTRHLSHLMVTINGAQPLLLSSAIADDNTTLTCDLTNPDLHDDRELVIGQNLVHARRTIFLWRACYFERVALHNYDDKPHRITLDFEFVADFVDLFEVRGSVRSRRGRLHPAVIDNDSVMLAYTGVDGLLRQTEFRAQPPPTRLTASRASFDFTLLPGAKAIVLLQISCDPRAPQRRSELAFFTALRRTRQSLRRPASRSVAITTSNQLFNEALRRAVADLYMLTTHLPGGLFPYAGIPWFSTIFGRDALITAMQTLWMDPSIARGVLAYLAANQAREHNDAADAQPGKILHEVRQGEMALLGEVPFRRYYGSVDSTPLFVMLAGAYLARTGDVAFLRECWPNIEAALEWIDGDGDPDGDGFVEYGRQTPDGLLNQGWKDSHDSIFHADGSLARGPIALVEVQAYVFAARRAAAAIARRLGHADRAVALEHQAETLRRRFDEAFWDDALGTYVLALDGEKRPCRVRTSNAGHALFGQIALPHRSTPLIANLMGGAQFSGWGVRTVASSEARFNPMSYHNGSVWPHDNAMLASGLAHYGFSSQAARIFEGLFWASTYIDLRRLPELVCGFTRKRGQGPTFYPVACSPQAWAATALHSLLQSCLGLTLDYETRRITLYRPVLPAFLDEVTLSGLSLADASVDIAVRRKGADEAEVRVLARQGDLEVIATP